MTKGFKEMWKQEEERIFLDHLTGRLLEIVSNRPASPFVISLWPKASTSGTSGRRCSATGDWLWKCWARTNPLLPPPHPPRKPTMPNLHPRPI